MNRYVSFLRGVNVGGRIVNMAKLKDVYEIEGMKDVKTFLQSGNVVFSSDLNDKVILRSMLEKAVTAKFNYNAKIFLLSREQLKYAYDNYSFEDVSEHNQDYIIFIESDLATKLYEQGRSLNSDIDKLALGKDVIYWQVPKGKTVLSPFSKLLVKSKFREFHTNRNIKTISKMLL